MSFIVFFYKKAEICLNFASPKFLSPCRFSYIKLKPGEEVVNMTIRYRTCGDMPITGAVESQADDLTKIIEEIATTRTTERGGRADDKRAETAMEDRKKQGYF